MIHVDRKRIPKPEFWGSPEFRSFLDAWSRFHGEEGGTRGTQRRTPVRGELDQFRELALEPLLAAFNDKCAYTEEPLSPDRATLVFHRPEADAVGLTSESSPEHYWWGVGDWSNWYPASRALRLAKSSAFPVAGERSSLPPRGEMPSPSWLARNRDRGLLLDPGRDHPAWHLEFRDDGVVHPREHPSPSVRSWAEGHSRGEITIKVLDLNNPRLRKGRREATMKAVGALAGPPRVTKSVEFLASSVFDPGRVFAAAARQAAARRVLFLLDERSKLEGSAGPGFALLIRDLAEELAAEIAGHGVPWTFGTAPTPLKMWYPLRRIFAREWPELGDGGWRRLVTGGTGRPEGTVKGIPADEEEEDESYEAFDVSASDLESERVVERSARIAHIKIRNFKAIEELDLDLSTEAVELLPRYGRDEQTLTAAGWTALLGENGSGKSCFLQALGLALAGDRLDDLIADAHLEWSRMLRRGATQGRVYLRFTGGSTVDLRFNARRHWWVAGAPRMAAFVRGYGATRLFEGVVPRGTGDGSNVRLANLFDPKAPVIDAERWLLDLANEGDFHVAALTLEGFLGADDALTPSHADTPGAAAALLSRDLERREVLVGGEPLSYASDGFRAVVALVCDVMAGLGVGLSDMRNATGIVLIDEIGAHLHPRWKMEITGRLRREFPQLQFVVSTHEPLCLRGLFAREVIRVRKLRPEPSAAPRVELELVERSPSDYRVDQLLTSEFFGLDTTIDPDLDRRFQAYYRLVAMTPDERAAKTLPNDPTRTLEDELTRLRAELRRRTRPVLGFTRRDQLVYEAIDEFLAHADDVSPEERRRRRRDTLEKIKDIWTPPDFLRRLGRGAR